jgi:hypothetical protein
MAEPQPTPSQPKLSSHPGSREQAPPDRRGSTDTIRLLARYCQAHGKPLLTRQLQREHLQDRIADQPARWKPATAHHRYRALHAFFKWAVAQG